ncbi:uncharacterized protein Tco025E_04559 [Trypanosoma conorhini]|uniref:Uncharacterized protein n=1 Tax=Trypanosoma conorhini TaxID=83891 RepID=A0A3R7MNV9_9TRYP|nr:uncharacterized protein Tco025E_04559 [Trypanosoma conorhini]RNF18280.1 hypothetical protein Tco025E_04559 [Trypanosoma conorhini]
MKHRRPGEEGGVPFGMRVGPVGAHRRRAFGEVLGNAAAAAAGDGAAVRNEGENCDEGPQPSCFVPTPEPRVRATAASASLLRAGNSTPPRPTGKAGNVWRESLLASSLLEGAALRRQSSAANVQRLDLRATAVDSVEWGWFCREVLPTMSGLTFLGLAEMGMTDKRLAELLRSCQAGPARRGTAPSPSSSSSLALSSGRSTGPVVAKSVAACEAVASATSRDLGPGRRASTSAASSVADFCERRALRRLGVLDLSGNRLTHRSATPLGKLLLWAADTLDELHLSGNPLQDYGLQILGIYLAKLRLTSLREEPHFFPPSLVRQYAAWLAQRRRHGAPQERRCGDTGGPDAGPASCGEAQIPLGISSLDLRGCQGSARGISEVLAGASHAHRLKTVLLAYNGVVAAALVSPRPTCTDGEIAPLATRSRDEAAAGADAAPAACRFSSFKELHYPCALRTLNLSGVPLSTMCTPIGCRELFLNIFFCCPNLKELDVSGTFDALKLPPSLLLQLLMQGDEASRDPRIYWRLQRELEGATEFTLDAVMLARQACAGGILCELAAHAAFNAQRRQCLAPPAFCRLRVLNLRGTGVTDRAARGLAIAAASAASTGVFSCLAALNLAENLLSLEGCMRVVHAFILDWPATPSVLSALALQGNTGIHRDDGGTILLLQQGAEAAVRRRCEERRRCGLAGGTRPPPPLRIHLGAVGEAAFCVASGEPAAEGNTAAEREDCEGAAGDKQGDAAVGGKGRENGFPPFHFGTGGALPASASFPSPLAAQLAGACDDVSSIHAGETPRRFLFSVPPTPSVLQRPADLVCPPEPPQRPPQLQRIESEDEEQKQRKRRRGVPILSPVVADEDLSVIAGSSTGAVAGETRRSSLGGVKLSAGFATPAFRGVVPLLAVAKEAQPWAAMDAATARAPSRNAGREATPLRPHERHVLQDTLTSFRREPSSIATSPPRASSKAFNFGCLFASMDAARDSGGSVEAETPLTRCHLNSEGSHRNGEGADTAEAKGARVSRDAAEVSPLGAEETAAAVKAAGGGPAVRLESGDAAGPAGETAAAFKPGKARRVKGFVMSYYHPVGHVLCRGWRLLHRGDAVGEDARACLARDVWALLQPPETQRGDVVVNSVSLATPSSEEDVGEDAAYGVTRLKITSNEHRSALAERLQQHANMEGGMIAFPLFMQALRQSEEDTVEVVAAMLDAARGRLPAECSGSTAEELVHARHGSEDELVAEIAAALAAGGGGGGSSSKTSQTPSEPLEEAAADPPFFSVNSVDATPLAEAPQLSQPPHDAAETREEAERLETEEAAPTTAVCSGSHVPHPPGARQAMPPTAAEPLPLPLPRARRAPPPLWGLPRSLRQHRIRPAMPPQQRPWRRRLLRSRQGVWLTT